MEKDSPATLHVKSVMDDSTHYAHMREYVRVQLQTRALFRREDSDEWLVCQLADVSGGGAQITLPIGISVAQSERILLHFRIGVHYQFEGSVVWVEDESRDKWPRVGVTWIDVDEAQRDRLILELLRVTVQRKRRR